MLCVRPSLGLLCAGMLLVSACWPATAPAAPSPPAPTTPPAAKPTTAPAAAPTAVAAAKPTTTPAAPTTAAAAKPTAAPAPAAQPTTAVAQAGQPKRGGILKVGLQADPTSLDTQKTSLNALFHVTEHIYSM